MSLINLDAGARTYIASLKVTPNFAGIADATNRADRKTLAYTAMTNAETLVQSTLVPKLEQLKADGLVRDWDFAKAPAP